MGGSSSKKISHRLSDDNEVEVRIDTLQLWSWTKIMFLCVLYCRYIQHQYMPHKSNGNNFLTYLSRRRLIKKSSGNSVFFCHTNKHDHTDLQKIHLQAV